MIKSYLMHLYRPFFFESAPHQRQRVTAYNGSRWFYAALADGAQTWEELKLGQWSDLV